MGRCEMPIDTKVRPGDLEMPVKYRGFNIILSETARARDHFFIALCKTCSKCSSYQVYDELAVIEGRKAAIEVGKGLAENFELKEKLSGHCADCPNNS